MSASQLIKVFVYGTLKSGQPNHHWLTNPSNGFAKFLTVGTTVQEFPMIIGTRYNIPFVLDRKGVGSNIYGEIYEIDESMFAKLDELEEYPDHYDREEQFIRTSNGKIKCWLYLLRNFPEVLLDRKFLSNYINCKDFPYCERSKRDENIKAKDDIDFDNPVVYFSDSSDDMTRDEMMTDLKVDYEKKEKTDDK